ncbi:MAG: hypothetical protein ALAOOOJD_02936 [bacterium]|nr:hypothetical protein [bacterium]
MARGEFFCFFALKYCDMTARTLTASGRFFASRHAFFKERKIGYVQKNLRPVGGHQ